MPIYEFECPEHGKFEEIFPLSKFDYIKRYGTLCGRLLSEKAEFVAGEEFYCKEICSLVWSIPGNIQIGAPTKVFINNKTGEIFSPFSKYDKPPIGYHEKELRNPVERSKFEKEQQRRTDAENQLTSHVLDEMKSDARKQRHDNLKSRMNAIQREEFTNRDGKTETVEFTLSEKDKALVSKAMERSKKKPRKEKKTDIKFTINHTDSSNMGQMR